MSDAWDVVVIGAGAAGLVAAAGAAERGRRVLLLEKNTKPGVKILMSGGTRCNLTHAVDARGIVAAFGRQGSFLHAALAALSPDDLVALFESEGVATKVEPGGKVFPASDRALDVLNALRRRLARSGATLALNEPVVDLQPTDGGSTFAVTTTHRGCAARRVVLTSGGQSYPGCGTTGDGYRWTAQCGHTIVPPCPALVPLRVDSRWAKALPGVTVPDVHVRIRGVGGDARLPHSADLSRAERRGALLFTHFGLSGPAVMDVSRCVTAVFPGLHTTLDCDFLPDLTGPQLLEQLQAATTQQGKRHVAALLAQWLPRRLADALLTVAGVPAARNLAELSRAERSQLAQALKATPFPVVGTLGFDKAEVTAGGVALEEVRSNTLESKLVPGLFLAGEILDLDGPIGGYNFQAAFSTGWLAGQHV
jgi:predicted Rossmann fold flavoprotein